MRHGLAGVCLVLMFTLGGCAIGDGVLMFPDRSVMSVENAARVNVPWRFGSLELWGVVNFDDGGEPDAYVLHFTGNGTRAEEVVVPMLDKFADTRVELWVLNYPGFGRSVGPANLDSAAESARVATRFVIDRANGKPVIVGGHSLGATVALHAAANEKVDGVYLENPIPLRELMLGYHGWYNLWIIGGPAAARVPDSLDATVNASRCRQPALAVVSDTDTVVPMRYQMQVVNAYASKMSVMYRKGKDHNDWADENELMEMSERTAMLIEAARKESAVGGVWSTTREKK